MKDLLDQFRLGRHEFENGHLEGLDELNPYDLFELWMREAVQSEELEPNAFVLGTSDLKNQSSTRIVYFKDLIEGGFVFYTNYLSEKGKDIEENPKVSMLFFWPKSSRQVRVEGLCVKTSAQISDDYFNSRPRASKIGAWASNQSDELTNRTELELRVKEFDEKFGDEVPRPDHWGGYVIQPFKIEFWQGRPSRLHDRLVFEGKDNDWKVFKLNP